MSHLTGKTTWRWPTSSILSFFSTLWLRRESWNQLWRKIRSLRCPSSLRFWSGERQPCSRLRRFYSKRELPASKNRRRSVILSSQKLTIERSSRRRMKRRCSVEGPIPLIHHSPSSVQFAVTIEWWVQMIKDILTQVSSRVISRTGQFPLSGQVPGKDYLVWMRGLISNQGTTNLTPHSSIMPSLRHQPSGKSSRSRRLIKSYRSWRWNKYQWWEGEI